MIGRRIEWGVTVLAMLGLVACRPPEPELPRPRDIVVVLIDCLRADHVGSYGYHRATTPHLDRVAERGAVFEWAFAQSHWTRPSVPTLLTGLYPNEHGLLEVEREKGKIVGPALADEVEMVSEALQAAGYATALIGEQFQLSPTFNLNQGFDLYQNRKDRAPNINRSYLRWLDGLEAGRQSFAYLHYLDIHWPYCPRGWSKGRFDNGESDLQICANWRQLRDDIRAGRQQLSAADVDRIVARYDEELLHLDDYLGTLFAELAKRGRWDETLLVVTADHGEEFFEHGQLGHQEGLYDTLIRVPLIIKTPASWGFEPRRIDDHVVELRSVAPTLRRAAGLPAGRGGGDLLALMRGDAVDGFTHAVAENSQEIALRTLDHKLVAKRESGAMVLYDLMADPGETTDVAAEQPDVVAELAGLLRRWRSSLRPVAAVRGEVDEGTVEGLRDLGYIE